MDIPEWIAVISVVVAILSLALQQHLTRKQGRAEARAGQYDRTTALLFKALDNPDLLEAISGGSDGDQRQRRFRQIWINHAQMIFRQRGLLGTDEWQSTVADIKDFMSSPELKKQWLRYEQYYARDFRQFISHEVYSERDEAPVNETPPEEKAKGQASAT